MRTVQWRRLFRPAAILVVGALAAGSALSGSVQPPEPAPDQAAEPTAADWLPWTVYGRSSASSQVTRIVNGVSVTPSASDFVSLSRRSGAGIGAGAVVCRFNLTLANASSARAPAQVLRFGSEFTTSNVDEPDSKTFARLGINTVESRTGFQLRDLVNRVDSPTFQGTQAITWVLNHAGASQSYSAPDGTQETILNDRMDVWVGRHRVFNDIAVTNPTVAPLDIKWFWGEASGTTTIDRFEVRPLSDFSGHESDEPTPAVEADGSVAPEGLSSSIQLHRPSPNPFARSTRYAYAIASQAARVDIGVYDVGGRRIRNLARGTQTPGQYEVEWDGRDEHGSRVRQGVYFLRASVGADQRVARVVYLSQ